MKFRCFTLLFAVLVLVGSVNMALGQTRSYLSLGLGTTSMLSGTLSLGRHFETSLGLGLKMNLSRESNLKSLGGLTPVADWDFRWFYSSADDSYSYKSRGYLELNVGGAASKFALFRPKDSNTDYAMNYALSVGYIFPLTDNSNFRLGVGLGQYIFFKSLPPTEFRSYRSYYTVKENYYPLELSYSIFL